MSPQSLYLKYRPQQFSDLIGQEHIAQTLKNALKNKHIAHAYLFCGPRGTGKTSTARLIAKALNCENIEKHNEPCNDCALCNDAMAGKLIDIIEIDAASNRGIDEIRDLKEKINFAPTRGKKKIYIIDEVHMLTKEAFNALLKTLEEPPEHSHFILATTEIHKVPETIISRCQKFNFRRINQESIISRLGHISKSESIDAEEKALSTIAQVARGGMRDAIGLLEQLSDGDSTLTAEYVHQSLGINEQSAAEQFCKKIEEKNSIEALNIIEGLYNQGVDLFEFCKSCVHYMREQLYQSINRGADTGNTVTHIEILQEAGQKLKSSMIPQLPLEIAVVKICQGPTVQIEPPTKPAVIEKPKKIAEVQKETKPTPKKVKPEPVSEVLQEKKPTPAPKPTGNLSTNFFKREWNKMIGHITSPSLRLSLKEAYPTELKGTELILHIDSSFHLEKINTTQNIQKLETAIEKFTEAIIKVRVVLAEKSLKPSPTIEKKETVVQETSAAPISVEGDLASQVADIFGGTVV